MSYVIVAIVALLAGFGWGVLFCRKNAAKVAADVAKIKGL